MLNLKQNHDCLKALNGNLCPMSASHISKKFLTTKDSTQITWNDSNHAPTSSFDVSTPISTSSHTMASNIHGSMDSPKLCLSQIALEQRMLYLREPYKRDFTRASHEARNSMGFGTSKHNIIAMKVLVLYANSRKMMTLGSRTIPRVTICASVW